MIAKVFEVRDRGTFIPMLAVKMTADSDAQSYLVHDRAGYPRVRCAVMITNLHGERQASSDPYFWGDRTYAVAHDYITENFDTLKDGDVVDVQFILGETKAPKISERFEHGG